MFFRMMVSAAALLAAAPALAGEQLQVASPGAWVRTTEVSAPQAGETDEVGYRYRLYDAQTRFEEGVRHSYLRYRILLTSPEGVGEGGVIALDWSQDHEDLTVHFVRVIRQGQVIEVLDSQQFEILRRENGFENSTVQGRLTAALHPADLRVGDELDVAFTVTRREPVVGALPEAQLTGALSSTVEHLHVAASWPDTLQLNLKGSEGWTVPSPRRRGGYNELVIDMDDVEPYFVPRDAPARFFHAREVQLSGYQGWADLVSVLAPFYDRASTPAEDSPLQAEIERIRTNNPTQQAQALAALRLVQDQVRYLAVLIGEGGWVPSSADDVWRLRQGDCKGKTVLLLALLRGLGIPAEAALVSTDNGDGLSEGLPRMHAFDHVVVRAELDGQPYWLDGTRVGDRTLERSAFVPFRQALVLAEGRTGLDAIEPIPAVTPATEVIEIVDASRGLFAPVTLTFKSITRGESGLRAAAEMQNMGAAARQQHWDAIIESMDGKIKDPSLTSVYDDALAAFVVTLSGRVEESLSSYGTINPSSLHLGAPNLPKRTTQFLTDAPHVVGYPSASIGRIDYRLPEGSQYEVYNRSLNFQTVGLQYARSVSVEGAHVTGFASAAGAAYEISHEAYEKARLSTDPRFGQTTSISLRGAYQPTAGDREEWARQEAEPDATKRAEYFEARIRELSALDLRDEAARAADKAVETTPDQASVWVARAGLRISAGDLDGAEADLDQAEMLDPANESLGYTRLSLARGRGDLREVILTYTRLLRLDPKNTAIMEARAFAYAGSNLGDRAVADMDAALNAADDSEKLEIKARKVDLLTLLARADEADTLSREIVDAAPHDLSVLTSRIDWLVGQGRAAEARELAQTVMSRDESEVLPHIQTLAAALALNGDVDGALTLVRRVIDANPDHSGAFNDGCWSLALAGAALDQAETWCEAALQASPDSAAIVDSRGRPRLQQGRYDEALADYDRALGLAALLPAARYGRGLALVALGREDEGREDMALAQRQSPEIAQSFRSYTGAR